MERQRGHAAFTITEVMIVLLIMSIIALAGLPKLTSSLEYYRLSGAGGEVVNALQYAQFEALKSSLETRVEIIETDSIIRVKQFKPNQTLWVVNSERDSSIVEEGAFQFMEHPLKKGHEYTFALSGEESMFGSVNITNVDFGGGNVVTFDTLGTPSNGGTVTLALGARQIVISVDALTGKVTASD